MTRCFLALTLLAGAAFGAGIALPRPAGEFVITTPSGPKRLSSYRGKLVVLNLLLTTCEHCQAATKALSQVQSKYGPQGVQVLGGAFDGNANVNLTKFLNLYSPTFPVGLAEPADVVSFTQLTPAMRPTAPILLFIDRKGQVRSQFVGSDPIFRGNMAANIGAEIEKYLKEK
jgi:thiol-disulfide isomerase/thioredoxin